MGVITTKGALKMRYKGLKYTLAMLLIAVSFTALARTSSPENPVRKMSKQKQESKHRPKISTEFGLGIGAQYNWFETLPVSADFTPNINMRMSYGGAFQFRLNIGKFFGIQPEISYAKANLKINDNAHGFSAKASSNVVQMPLLFSIKLAMLRLNAGPVFTLMDETTYNLALSDDTLQQMPIGRLYPAVTYAAGVALKLGRFMMLDLRYADQFRDIKSTNQYVWTLDTNKQPKAQEFRTRSRSVQLRYSVVF